MKQSSAILLTFALAAAGSFALADDMPVGRWRQIDDETGAAKSIVKIYQENGVLNGRIVELLKKPDAGKPSVCDRCEGELKDAPILGFPLLSGMKKEGSEWTGGTIIDPKNGKRYRAKMALRDNGQKLEVRGFIGFSLFGRTQVWERVEASPDSDGVERRVE
ncbi:MAG TPA: DUF2147 domain-containing protein [Burkholderiales bacterium]|nr:DUF2147 domain-containing protein [Burkholderiales bacterium]